MTPFDLHFHLDRNIQKTKTIFLDKNQKFFQSLTKSKVES